MANLSKELCGDDDVCCQIFPLETASGDNFGEGKQDSFGNKYLKGCQDFHLHGLKSVKMWMVGSDGWLGDWAFIGLNNNKIAYYCPISERLDDDGTIYISCSYWFRI